MKFIGITGGVGAGKSEILAFLEENYSAKVIRTDDLAKSLMEPGAPCYEEVCRLFLPEDITTTQGTIDKNKMAQCMFEHPALREKTNQLIHPAVKKEVLRQVEAERKKGELDYFFVEAALLIEDHYDELCDELWYIYTTEENRRQRLKAARGYSDEKISAIFASQLSEDVFREYCKEIIDNNHAPEEAFACVRRILD